MGTLTVSGNWGLGMVGTHCEVGMGSGCSGGSLCGGTGGLVRMRLRSQQEKEDPAPPHPAVLLV